MQSRHDNGEELRDPWSFLEIVFVGQCEVFVCLGFV